MTLMQSGFRDLLIFTVFAILGAPAASAQERHPVTGREYASVMRASGANWLERATREDEEHPRRAVQLLGLKNGITVADVGAGSGYYTELIAQKVGPQGKVLPRIYSPK